MNQNQYCHDLQEDDFVKGMIKMANEDTLPEEELEKLRIEQFEKQTTPEFIDQYIYNVEHGYSKDCTITIDWEIYKMRVGYYDRHPERKEESQKWTFRILGVPNLSIEQ